jgi:hypothetical protein
MWRHGADACPMRAVCVACACPMSPSEKQNDECTAQEKTKSRETIPGKKQKVEGAPGKKLKKLKEHPEKNISKCQNMVEACVCLYVKIWS